MGNGLRTLATFLFIVPVCACSGTLTGGPVYDAGGASEAGPVDGHGLTDAPGFFDAGSGMDSVENPKGDAAAVPDVPSSPDVSPGIDIKVPDTAPSCPKGAVLYKGKCARKLRVLSYNVAAYMYQLKNKNKPLYGDPEPVLQKLAAMIKQQGVHLVGLQEVENNATWHKSVHMHNRLLSILTTIGYPMHGKFQKRFDAHGGKFGISLLSKFPIVGYTVHKVASQVYLQSAGVQFNGEPIRFYNYHPFPGTGACVATQGAAFKSAISAHLNHTSFVAGDFNFTRAATCYKTMTTTHVDTCTAAGGGSCLSTVDLSIRTDIKAKSLGIDYVFARFSGAKKTKWQVAKVHADQNANKGQVMSDHFPVFAEFVRYE